MELPPSEPEFIAEERLVETMITGKPSVNAFIVATTSVLIITLVTLFYWQASAKWSDYFPAVNEQVFQHKQIWRIFTAMLVHADIAHLLSNMYMFWIFSFFVFGYFGFGIFPVLSFLIGGIVNGLAILTYAPGVELIGASGLVYVLGGFWLTLYPLIQRQYTVANRTMRAIGIAFMIFLPSTFTPTTSYRTHAIGFAFGIAMGLYYFAKNRKKIRSYERFKVNYVQKNPFTESTAAEASDGIIQEI